jgi:hypothetical protein
MNVNDSLVPGWAKFKKKYSTSKSRLIPNDKHPNIKCDSAVIDLCA